MDLEVPADYRANLRQNDKPSDYLKLVRGLKNLRNKRVTVGALGIILKKLVKTMEELEIRGRIPKSITESNSDSEESVAESCNVLISTESCQLLLVGTLNEYISD